jgi:hypothetical protein
MAAPPSARSKKRTIVWAAGLTLGALALAGLWWLGGRSEQQAISKLAPDERRALYERTLQNLKSTCRPERRPSGLDDYCQRQADFILKFPECDRACEDLATQQTNQPSR